MLLLISIALSGEHFIEVSEPQLIGGENYAATWARAFPAEEGWYFFRAAGDDYQVHKLDDDLNLLDAGTKLTGRDDLVDHGISLCPDGTWLHVGTTNSQPNANDGAWAFRYDADFTIIVENELAAGDATTRYNDAPVVCTNFLDGSLFTYNDESETAPFVRLNDDAEVSKITEINAQPHTTGGAMIWENETQNLLLVRAWVVGPRLVVERYDRKMNLVATPLELQFTNAEDDLYWPQGLLRLGDYYYLAYMQRPASPGDWSTDTGNVWIAAFDMDWNILERVQLTDYQPDPDRNDMRYGAMQPWLARKGATLLVLYDNEVQPTVITITIDGSLADPDTPEDNEPIDTGDTAVSGDLVADAGADVNGVVGEIITFDGSASYGGGDLLYTWTVTQAAEGSSLETSDLYNGDSAEVVMVADVAGTYELTLTVSDGTQSATDTVVATVTLEEESCGGCGGAGAPGLVVLLGGLLAVRRRR